MDRNVLEVRIEDALTLSLLPALYDRRMANDDQGNRNRLERDGESLPTGRRRGFTLIELSIVLVIIGLIVGGILVGQDMIHAAAIRAQVSQIEKYDSAVNTFKTKYHWLPGDLPAQDASGFGLEPRDGTYGRGDGNGILQDDPGYPTDSYQQGELLGFWNDLANASLIGDPIYINNSTYVDSCPQAGVYPTPAEAAKCFPICKLGGAKCLVQIFTSSSTLVTYYFLEWPSGSLQFSAWPTAVITPTEAFSIDTKIDDGGPFTGRITLSQPGNASLSVADNPGATACALNTTTYNVGFSHGNQPLCIPRIKVGF